MATIFKSLLQKLSPLQGILNFSPGASFTKGLNLDLVLKLSLLSQNSGKSWHLIFSRYHKVDNYKL